MYSVFDVKSHFHYIYSDLPFQPLSQIKSHAEHDPILNDKIGG